MIGLAVPPGTAPTSMAASPIMPANFIAALLAVLSVS
jgi:hypothetical protein